MSEPGQRSRFWLVTVIMGAFIVYGSLYPFDFHIPPHGPGPVALFLTTWDARPGRGDFLANILLYIPFGFFFLLGFRQPRSFAGVLLPAVFTGALLSLCIELTQYYDTGRDTEATDFYANTLGSLMGALAAFAGAGRFGSALIGEVSAPPAALILAWLGYRLYPFVPTIDLHKYWNALKPLFLTPTLTGYDLFRQAAIWLALCALIDTAVQGRRSIRLIPLFALTVLCAKVLIVDAALRVAEPAGFGVAFAVWLLLLTLRRRARAGIAGTVLSGYVVASRLEPFQFLPAGRPFGWIPFHSLMFGSLVVDTLSFLEKFFLYGSMLYLLGIASGGRTFRIAVIVAVLLFATSWMQTFLPDRSAQITDTLMVLVIALIFALLPPETDSTAARTAAAKT